MELHNTKLTLSFNPKEISFEKYAKDFTFIVNGKEYPTSRFVADILSPRIRHLHSIDQTIDSFNISIPDSNEKCDFSDILSLMNFEPKSIDKDNISYFSKIFLELGNKQAYYDLFPKYSDDMTATKVFEIIQQKKEFIKAFDFSNESEKAEIKTDYEALKQEIDFIANHFYEIDQENLKNLDLQTIEYICRSEKLQLKSEDSFLQFIIDVYKSNQEAYLFDYVDFFNVSDEELIHFSQAFDLNDITSSIWKMIIERSIKNHEKPRNIKRYLAREFIHDENHELNGIIRYLTRKAGGNIHDKGLIEVSTNSQNQEHHLKNLLDDNDSYYEATQNSNVYLLFDFKKMKVNLSCYSIRSYHVNANNCHLKNWKIEVSDDGENWKIIDQRSKCPTLNGNRVLGTFKVQPSNFSRFVRLSQTGELWGIGHIWLHDIEFYGLLKE